MKKYFLLVTALLMGLGSSAAFAGPCPAQIPTSRGNGMVPGVAVASGTQYYFKDAKLDGFDCFEQLSSWFPSYIGSSSSINPAHQVVDMAYTVVGTATFSNVVVPTTGNYLMTVRYAFAQGLFPGVLDRPEGIMVNGTVITSNMHFPVTGDFENYQDSSIVIPLNGGVNTIQMFNVASQSISRADAITISPITGGSCALTAPTGATATSNSATEVTLNWNAGNGSSGCTVDHYNVYRSTTQGFAPTNSNLIAGGLTNPSYVDTTGICGTTYYYVIEAATANAGDQSAFTTDVTATTSACPIISSIAINSQGPAVGSFLADEDFAGGGNTSHANTIDLSGVSNPAPMALYQTSRSGNFTYTLPHFAPGSTHTVRLHFAETFWTKPGQRVFNVSINGNQVLTNFDIFAAAGAKNKAVVEQFTADASATGQYVITFTNVTDNALLAGIEIQ
jgi:Malectin domain